MAAVLAVSTPYPQVPLLTVLQVYLQTVYAPFTQHHTVPALLVVHLFPVPQIPTVTAFSLRHPKFMPSPGTSTEWPWESTQGWAWPAGPGLTSPFTTPTHVQQEVSGFLSVRV